MQYIRVLFFIFSAPQPSFDFSGQHLAGEPLQTALYKKGGMNSDTAGALTNRSLSSGCRLFRLTDESLCFQPDFTAVGGDQESAGRLGRHVADYVDAPHAHHLLLPGERHGEKQLVILAAIERRR